MSFKNLSLKRSYNSDFDDILHDFYIPVLSEAVEYRRMAGFFTSTSLSVASRGIIGLVENDGIMRIVTSPKLTSADIKIIKDATQNPEKFLESKYFEALSSIDNGFIRNHIALLVLQQDIC